MKKAMTKTIAIIIAAAFLVSSLPMQGIACANALSRSLVSGHADVYTSHEESQLLAQAKNAIGAYLIDQRDKGSIAQEIYDKAIANTYKNIESWVKDENIKRLFPNARLAILDAVKAKRWAHLVEAFRQDISFGTAGIRGKSAFTEVEFNEFVRSKLNARILKGPNTINEVVLLLKTAGLIQYMKRHSLKRVAIGYDSRIAGAEMAELIAQLFLGVSTAEHEFTVYLFDEPCPFPELSFGVTKVRADIGILISASHNPKNYNGYKITNYTGAQLGGDMRDEIVEDIKTVTTSHIQLRPLNEARAGQLRWLGGKERVDRDYYGVTNPEYFTDMHTEHVRQINGFFVDEGLVERQAGNVRVGFAAYNGAGYKAVPRMLAELGFVNTKVVSKLQKLDGTFPAFRWGEQPDPGDPIAADIASREFAQEHGEKALEGLDLLIGTDPDADRAGFVIPIPQKYQSYFDGRKTMLLSANDAWTLIIWYRLMRKKELGQLSDPQNRYITFSHVTSDALEKVARFFGIKCLGLMVTKDKKDGSEYLNDADSNKLDMATRTWVGFTYIGETANKLRTIGLVNEGGAEESNGFSILGGAVAEGDILGIGAHVNDKDGPFAAMLMAEVACFAKEQGTNIFELFYKNIYLNPRIGMYATANKPLPRVGSFEGAGGVTEKINLLKKAQTEWMPYANNNPGVFEIAGIPVIGAVQFRRGGYDKEHYDGFPDEGIRFFFPDPDLKEGVPFTKSQNYITIRPSGTSQTIRFYVQLKGRNLTKDNVASNHRNISAFAERVALEAQLQLLEAVGLKKKYGQMVTGQLGQPSVQVSVDEAGLRADLFGAALSFQFNPRLSESSINPITHISETNL